MTHLKEYIREARHVRKSKGPEIGKKWTVLSMQDSNMQGFTLPHTRTDPINLHGDRPDTQL